MRPRGVPSHPQGPRRLRSGTVRTEAIMRDPCEIKASSSFGVACVRALFLALSWCLLRPADDRL